MNFKFVTSGQALDNAPVVSQVIYGTSLRPLPPANVRGSRDSLGNLLIEWTRRSRLGIGMIPGSDVPLGEEILRWDIEIMNGSTVVRTIRAYPNDSQLPGWEVLADPKSILTIAGDASITINSTSGAFGSTIILSRQVFQPFETVMFSFSADTDQSGANACPRWIGFIRTSRISGDLVNNGNGADWGWITSDTINPPLAKGYTPSLPNTVALSNTRLVIRVKNNVIRMYQDPGMDVDSSAPLNPQAIIASESYRILFENPTNQAVGKAVKVNQPIITRELSSATYAAADQVADFGSTQSSITVRIYGVSSIIGRGPYTQATL